MHHCCWNVQSDRQVYEVVSGFRSSWYWVAIGRVSGTRRPWRAQRKGMHQNEPQCAHYCRNRLSETSSSPKDASRTAYNANTSLREKYFRNDITARFEEHAISTIENQTNFLVRFSIKCKTLQLLAKSMREDEES